MIVQPDFFDHWKTRALVELTGRPESPLWLLRLWAYCQCTRNWRFKDTPPLAIKSICHVPPDIAPEAWLKALIDCRFLDSDDSVLSVHGFREYNAGLVKNWVNGRRPKAKPARSQREAKAKPNTPPPPSGISDRGIVDGWMDQDGLKKRKRESHAPDRPKDLAEVESYATSHAIAIPASELAKFYHHFNAAGWRTGDRPLRSWPSALAKWVLRMPEFAAQAPIPKNSAPPPGETAPRLTEDQIKFA